MQPNDESKKKRKQLTSQDLKRRLYEKGMHGSSMPSLKSPLTITTDKQPILYVNLNSSGNKKQSGNSPKILKKTASAFGSKSRQQKGFFPSITASEFMSKKKSSPFTNSPKAESPSSPTYKTAVNFFQSKKMDSQPQQQVPQFNSSFYKVDSTTRNNETRMTKRLVQKMSGRKSKYQKESGKSRFAEDQPYRQTSPPHQQQRDEIVEHEDTKEQSQQHAHINSAPPKQQSNSQIQSQRSSLQQYISLILKNVPNVDEFLYLIRHKTSQSLPEQENVYQLEIIDYQQIKQKDKDPNFQYYTISKKGFCHYYGGKPIQFIDLKQWLQEKQIYEKIKKLKFFSRFRRWKTIKMWIKKVVRHRIEKCSLALQDRLFILNPTIRSCILDINSINLEMQKSLCIISKNQGTYTLESFKHCQQKTRRQSASIVEEFSRRSRQSVRKCFDQNLENLKELLKTRANYEDKNFTATTHNPKDNAFQVLGFPAKMSYEHRSKLRKLTGRFVRFSYLIDFLHLNGLAGIFKTQIQSFSSKLNKLQIESSAQVICMKQRNKSGLDQNSKQRMFNIQLVFKPYEISQAYVNEIPLQIFDISMKMQKAAQLFNPLYHIKEKVSQIKDDPNNHPKLHLIKEESVKQVQYRKYIPSICDLWLTMKPTLDNIFDELSFLIKQSMASLKYFERWSKHRQMQKYINILEQWDDIVSENWQICQNDNLDPISIIENLQSSMTRIKQMLQVSQHKLTQKIVQNTINPLNIYWQNTQANVDQLLTNPNIENNAQTIEFYLAYMSQWIEKFQLQIPNLIQLGIFTVSLERMKYQVIEFMKQKCQNFKNKLPQYVEQNTNDLNIWLSEKSQLLRQEIHNIDDFVRLNKSLKIIDEQFNHKKQLCNDLGHIYQTMYNYKIESKKRKQFQVNTLKAKDQLQQLLIHVEQNIQRKTQFFTRQVSRYHLPNLLKEIQKISDNIGSQQFQSLKSSSENVIRKLVDIKKQYDSLKDKKTKCLQYLTVLKLSEVGVTELDQLERQINARLEMWQNLQIFNEFMRKIDTQVVSQMDLQALRQFVTQKRQIVKSIESIHNRPQNEVLRLLKSKVQKYFINLPLLQGFNDRLSESHWQEIDQIVKNYQHLDLKKKQFTLKQFLQTGIGKESKKIEYIFNKAKVENELQMMYSQVENAWCNTLVKAKTQSKFVIISNPQVMRQAFDYMLKTLCTIFSNPFSQTLRQYSLTYDTLIQYYNTFEHWLLTQEHLLKIDSMCKLLDIKKLPDYSQFQNCQKIYKIVMKHFIGNRSIQNGVKMNKLFVVGLDDRLTEMDQALKKVQDNIKTILEEHRKNYPPFYIFDDQQLFAIITTPGSHQTIQSTALKLVPSLSRLEFENQRITGIYNIDNEKLQRNAISINLDIEQIVQQLRDTVVDNTKKAMRSCKYKAVETSLIKLVPLFHCQYLLAVSKTDFTNYTEISIDNQSHSPQSLKEFYKVMKKDIIEDLRLRSTIKDEFISRYDTLILQSLYHQEVLSKMIKGNIKQTTDYEWQKLFKFYWDEGNNEDNNITVKQCHTKLKYGNEYIGSKTKVVIQCDTSLLYSLSQAESAIMTSSIYQLQRVMNFIGQRLAVFQCDNFTKSSAITNFLISCWYWQTPTTFKNFNLLEDKVKEQLLTRKTFREMKQCLLKKNSFNIKQNQKRQSAMFLSQSHQNYIHQFRGAFRTVTNTSMTHNHIKNLLRVKDVFETQNEISSFLMKLFEMLNYLQEKSINYNLSIEDFLQNKLVLNSEISKKTVFDEFLKYIKPKIGSDTMNIIEETVRLEMTSENMFNENMKEEIIELSNSKMLAQNKSSHKDNLIVKDRQKLTTAQKRSSSRPSNRQIINASKLTTQNGNNKHQSSSTTLSVANNNTSSKPKPKLSKLPIIQQPTADQLKQRQVRSALEYRQIVVLTGIGQSKLHLIKTLYSLTHNIIEVFSSLQSQHLMKQGIVTYHIRRSIQSSEPTTSQSIQYPTLLYFNGIDNKILNQLQCICHNANYSDIREKLRQKNTLIVIATEKLPQIDYSSISWLYVINVELQPQYLVEIGKEWSMKYLKPQKQQKQQQSLQQNASSLQSQPQSQQQPNTQQQFMKFYQQTLLATFDNWSIKDIKLRQRYVYMFLTYLQSLLPVKKLLQAMVYCFIRLFSNLDADYIKLQFLVKKLIGQDKISEDEKVYELVYYSKPQSEEQKRQKQQSLQQQQQSFQQFIIPNREQGLITSKQYFQAYCDYLVSHNNHTQHNQSAIIPAFFYNENIPTHKNFHNTTIINKILTNTNAGIYLIGPTNSGKSTLYQLYKQFYYDNKLFLRLTMLDCGINKRQFKQKILNNVNVWSLKEIKSKINYQTSIVMVDNIGLTMTNESVNHSKQNVSNAYVHQQHQKLMLIKQLLQYKLIQYPSTYYPPAFHKKLMSLSNVNFILSGHQQLQEFKPCTIPLQLTLHQPQLKSIFNQYLRYRLNYFEINDLAIADIVATTYDICKKLSMKNTQFDGLELVATKGILGKFMLLRIKDLSGNIIKEVEKYWVYLLQQHLEMYDVKYTSTTNKQQKSLTESQTTKLASTQQSKKQKSIIYKQLKNLNLQEIKPSSLCYSFLHTKTSTQSFSTNQYSKKVQFVKDIKRIFNTINEKIQKYNQSENKRFGNTFEYIHFDQLIKKIVKLSNNLIGKDYLLHGRKGSGKQSLVKLVAYLQGSNYKPVLQQSTLKQTITDIFLTSNITTMSSFLITKQLHQQKEIYQLEQYYYCDFQNQILNNKQLDKPQKVFIKQKEKQQQRQRQKQRQLKMLNTSTNSRNNAQRTFVNNALGFGTPEYYIPPRQKLSQEDVLRYKQAIRVVILVSDRQLLTKLPIKIKQQFMIDELQEIPISSMQQYTTKFLQAQEIKSSPKISLLLAQIWNYAKDELSLTLRDYDDSIRLYCSFVDTLTDQVKQQLNKYGRVIELFNYLRKLNESLQKQVESLHSQIKQLTQQMILQETQQKKLLKHSIQQEMHKKSTYLNKSQKIIQMYDNLIPYFKQKHSMILKYVMDKDYFEESLAVAACYFTFMSQMRLQERRKMLVKWYGNNQNGQNNVPLLQSSQQIVSFLPLFNLYPEEFNTQPIDDLQDFYENMAIVFNSVKPVFIQDTSHRGKHWLQSVCSFVCVSQKQSNFIQVICQNLIKPSNILIEISSQQTMNNLSNSFIHGLLFLSDNTQTINIKGVDYKVSPQAKFYVLLNENVQLSQQQKQQFTIVQFSQSMKLLQKQLEYAMMSTSHADVFYSQLEMKKKVRNLKLERQALMLEIADNVYSAYEETVGLGDDKDSEDNSQQEQSIKKTQKSNTSSKKPSLKQSKVQETKKTQKQQQKPQKQSTKQSDKKPQPTSQQLQQFISQLTDKTLTRGQNLSNKLKQKQQLCKQIQSKLSFTSKHTNQIKLFVQTAIEIYDILQFISQKGLQAHNNEYTYVKVTHLQFVKRITLGLKRKFIRVEKLETLLLFAIKMWGDQYVDSDFYVYLMAILGLNSKLEHKLQFKQQEGIKSMKGLHEHQLIKLHDSNYHSHNKGNAHHQITLTSAITQILKSSTNYQQLKKQLQQQFTEFLSTFPHDFLIPYFHQAGTINNLHEEEIRRVTLNTVWVNVNKQHTISSRFNDQKLQQNLKIVKLQIKSMQNLQHQIKKYIFEENILMISSFQLLQSTLDHLVKLGSHEKIIYFNCPLVQSSIDKVLKLAKKYSVTQINHIYQNKNLLLQQCLLKMQRQRESRKLSSVRNINSIKSIKSIGMIKYDNDYVMDNVNQGKSQLNTNEQQSTQQQQQVNLLTQQQPMSLKKTLRSQKNLIDIQKQHLSSHMPRIVNSLYSILSHEYLKHNIKQPYINPSQAQVFSQYLLSCTFTQDQQFTLRDKLTLLLKVMQNFVNQKNVIIDEEISNKFIELNALIEEILSNSSNNNKANNNNNTSSKQNTSQPPSTTIDQKLLLQTLQAKLQQLSQQLQIQSQHLLNKLSIKAKKVQFQNQHISYLKHYFPSINQQSTIMDLEILVNKAKQIFYNIKNIDQPIVVKRNSRKSLNAIFRKQQLREKLLSSQSPPPNFTTNTSMTNLHKKPAIKRISKQSFLTTPTNQQQHKLLEQLLKQQHKINLAPVMLEIEHKKLSSKIHFLTHMVQNAIKDVPNIQAIELLLLLLEDAIPGAWFYILQHNTFSTISLQSLFKKIIRLQQDMSFCLQKVKRNIHSQVDFTFLKFPKDYLQLHFKKKLSDKMNDQISGIYVLMNTPSNEELENSEDHVKIASIQYAGWKFSPTEANAIDILSGTQKPTSSQAKLSPSCCFVKKDISTINTSSLTPIDVYESKESPKPFMKVYAVCKKVTNVNSTLTNNLSLFLKDSSDC